MRGTVNDKRGAKKLLFQAFPIPRSTFHALHPVPVIQTLQW